MLGTLSTASDLPSPRKSSGRRVGSCGRASRRRRRRWRRRRLERAMMRDVFACPRGSSTRLHELSQTRSTYQSGLERNARASSALESRPFPPLVACAVQSHGQEGNPQSTPGPSSLLSNLAHGRADGPEAASAARRGPPPHRGQPASFIGSPSLGHVSKTEEVSSTLSSSIESSTLIVRRSSILRPRGFGKLIYFNTERALSHLRKISLKKHLRGLPT